jgi:lysozyme-like protein
MGIWYVDKNFQPGAQPNKITIQQAIQYAQQAGFSGTSLYTAVAIAISESGLAINSANSTTSGVGTDRGIVKFNSVFHRDVPDACAYDPACAFKEFYRVSQGGKNFCQWCTYNLNCANPCNSNGPYKANLAMVQAAAAGVSPLPSTPSTTGTGGGFLDTFKSWGEYVGIFLLALLFILAGFYLLNEQKVNQVVHSGVDAALRLTV